MSNPFKSHGGTDHAFIDSSLFLRIRRGDWGSYGCFNMLGFGRAFANVLGSVDDFFVYRCGLILTDKHESNHAIITLKSVPESALLVITKVTMTGFTRTVLIDFVLPYCASSSEDIDQLEPKVSWQAGG